MVILDAMPTVLVDMLSYTGTKGGGETYTRELYRAIGAEASEFEFIGLASKEGYALDHDWFPGRVIASGISGENRLSWAVGELFRVTGWAKRLDADLIHSPMTLGTMRRAVPSVVTMHDMHYWSHPEFMSTPLFTGPVRWMERQASVAATRIITDSNFSRGEIIHYLGVPPEQLDVVLLAGTPLKGINRSTEVPESQLVLAMGNRRPHKNWASLIRALPYVDETIRPHLVITGSHGEDPLISVVNDTQMHNWVELKSWVSAEEMRDLYARATILAMPSFTEGFSLPVLEAMMAGLPVMLSDIPTHHEVGGDSALYFDPASPHSIAEAMTSAVTHPELLSDLSRRGREQAALFSWSRTAEGTLATFRRALIDSKRNQ